MKNLNLWDINVKNINQNGDDNSLFTYGHVEGNEKELYVCSHNLVVRCFGEDGAEKWAKDLSELSTPDNKAVDITFLPLTEAVCVGLGNGELFTIGSSGEPNLVGVCDNGILAMQWSPDEELLVLVTKDMKSIVMSCTFDSIHEMELISKEFGEKQFITVGWGKKETQFHGSEGKKARVKAEVTADTQGVIDDAIKITWRGDSSLYAIGFNLDGLRRFKVFDREGHLQYTSEKQQGLESNLCWRPSGNVIATTQKLPEKYVISFFEKNGLKHGEFDIPVNNMTIVEDLLWSSDSEIITLLCRDTDVNIQKLLLFTMGNYHWYLKQELVFKDGKIINKILWGNDFEEANNKKLHVVLKNGKHVTYTWIWNVDHSRGRTEKDDAVVAVIDGKKLLLNGFRQTVVPPPMAALEINLEVVANSVHFPPHERCNDDANSFFVVTSDCKLLFYDQIKKFPLQYKLSKTIDLETYNFPFQFYNWCWLSRDTILCIKIYECHTIIEYKMVDDKLVKQNEEILPSSVMRIECHPTDLAIAFLLLNNGDILKYTKEGNIEPIEVSFGVTSPKFNVFCVEDDIHFIGLTHKGQLYLDDKEVMNNVSSFFVHTHFLLITTLQHMLLSAELSKAGINAIREYSLNNEYAHIYKRKIERGAKLVIVVPNDTRTVFQMPRGNLETIQPRPLSLKIIGEFLDSLKYHEAFDLMRKQRINLNLIFDHDPDRFVQNINVFLESINNNSWLSLFISDLENVNVTKTMYVSSYTDKKDKAEVNNKVQKICELVRYSLSMRSDTDSRILPFLTSFVKTNTVEDLESALSLVKDLKKREEGGSKLPVGADEALKYLLYMVDVNNLFDVALGMYDFDLVLLVATKSQKDPKEYIPMLNELNEMKESYKKFSINKHLKRFDKAVRCLVECGEEKHGELRTFVKYHSLYREALSLFSPGCEIYKQISDDFGSYLRLKKQFVEAGLVYERGSNYDKAIDCYKDALEWELAINLAQTWPEESFKELCWDLINALKEEKRLKEALTILEHYYDNNEETIRFAIEFGQYKAAIRLCTQFKKFEWREEKLLPALLDDYQNLQELVETNWSNFIRHRDRLRVIRENKKNNPVDLYDGSFANKDSDLYSDAGSTLASSSRGSSRSYRSSKNRRKHERKVASLKEGSQYEDVALVMALHSLVVSSFDLRSQVKEVNVMLSCFGKHKEAFVLQMSLDKLLKEMKDSFKEIWTNELVLEATNAVIAAQSAPDGGPVVIPQGIASLEPHIRIAPLIQDVSWKLNGLF